MSSKHAAPQAGEGSLISKQNGHSLVSGSIPDPFSPVHLAIRLPNGHWIEDFACKAATTFGDVLVQACGQHRLASVMHALVSEEEFEAAREAGAPLSQTIECKATQLVGLTPRRRFVLVERSQLAERPDNYRAVRDKKTKAAKVEVTNRVLVHLPQQKRLVVRVNLKESIRKVFDQVCSEKDLYPPEFVVCHPDSKEPLDLQRSLDDYGLTELLIERICRSRSATSDSWEAFPQSVSAPGTMASRSKAKSAVKEAPNGRSLSLSKATAAAGVGGAAAGASFHGSSVSLSATGERPKTGKKSKVNAFLTFLRIKKKKKKNKDVEIESPEDSGPMPSFSPARERAGVMTVGRPASVFTPPLSVTASGGGSEVPAREAPRYKKRRAPRPPTFGAASPDSLDDQLASQSAAGLSQSAPALPVTGLVAVELELEPAEVETVTAADLPAEQSPEKATEARRQHHSSHDTGFHSAGSNEVDIAGERSIPRKKRAPPTPPAAPSADRAPPQFILPPPPTEPPPPDVPINLRPYQEDKGVTAALEEEEEVVLASMTSNDSPEIDDVTMVQTSDVMKIEAVIDSPVEEVARVEEMRREASTMRWTKETEEGMTAAELEGLTMVASHFVEDILQNAQLVVLAQLAELRRAEREKGELENVVEEEIQDVVQSDERTENIRVEDDELKVALNDKEELRDNPHKVEFSSDDVQEVQDNVQEVQDEVHEIQDEVQEVQDKVQEVQDKVQEVQDKVQEVQDDVQEVQDEVQEVRDDVEEGECAQDDVLEKEEVKGLEKARDTAVNDMELGWEEREEEKSQLSEDWELYSLSEVIVDDVMKEALSEVNGEKVVRKTFRVEEALADQKKDSSLVLPKVAVVHQEPVIEEKEEPKVNFGGKHDSFSVISDEVTSDSVVTPVRSQTTASVASDAEAIAVVSEIEAIAMAAERETAVTSPIEKEDHSVTMSIRKEDHSVTLLIERENSSVRSSPEKEEHHVTSLHKEEELSVASSLEKEEICVRSSYERDDSVTSSLGKREISVTSSYEKDHSMTSSAGMLEHSIPSESEKHQKSMTSEEGATPCRGLDVGEAVTSDLEEEVTLVSRSEQAAPQEWPWEPRRGRPTHSGDSSRSSSCLEDVFTVNEGTGPSADSAVRPSINTAAMFEDLRHPSREEDEVEEALGWGKDREGAALSKSDARARCNALEFQPEGESEEEALEVKFVAQPELVTMRMRAESPPARARSTAEIHLSASEINGATAVDSKKRNIGPIVMDTRSHKSNGHQPVQSSKDTPVASSVRGGSMFFRPADPTPDPVITDLERQLVQWQNQLEENRKRIINSEGAHDQSSYSDSSQGGNSLLQQQIDLQRSLMQQMEKNIHTLKSKRTGTTTCTARRSLHDDNPDTTLSSRLSLQDDTVDTVSEASGLPASEVAPAIVRQRDLHREAAKPIFDSRLHGPLPSRNDDVTKAARRSSSPPAVAPKPQNARAARMAARAERRSESGDAV